MLNHTISPPASPKDIPVAGNKRPATSNGLFDEEDQTMAHGRKHSKTTTTDITDEEVMIFRGNVEKLYQEKLHEPAPLSTFVMVGMQSSAKSTFVERMANVPINVVKQGTGTRCPIDITCVRDETCVEAVASLSGSELARRYPGTNLKIVDAFGRINQHNEMLENQGRFSTHRVELTVRWAQAKTMRLVDLPGVIDNTIEGHVDNREDIKTILRHELKSKHAQLVVMLEPTEYEKNPIFQILDSAFDGKRSQWHKRSIFVMSKFDRLMNDLQSGNRANDFFTKYQEAGVLPYLLYTQPVEIEFHDNNVQRFHNRSKILDCANEEEMKKFEEWFGKIETFARNHRHGERLGVSISDKVGFSTIQTYMRQKQIENTRTMLPVIAKQIRQEKLKVQAKLAAYQEKMKMYDPTELKSALPTLLTQLEKRLMEYIEGDFSVARKFGAQFQTLQEELEAEGKAKWSNHGLNYHFDTEKNWRDGLVATAFPEHVQADLKFLGGKQIKRAFHCHRHMLINSLPDDISQFVEAAMNCAGYGRHEENWEGMVDELCNFMIKDVSQPGVNVLGE